MSLDDKITNRFQELIRIGEHALRTTRDMGGNDGSVDIDIAVQWGVSSLSFIGRVLGKKSEHYEHFARQIECLYSYHPAKEALAALKASYDDYAGGYLFDTRQMIHAEVFSDFIDQAQYLIETGYFQAGVVIAGAVLEDTLRQLADRVPLALPDNPKLDLVNAELAKGGVYDKLVQKKITWIADIRNKAAHGDWKAFTAADASEVVKVVRRFVEEYR